MKSRPLQGVLVDSIYKTKAVDGQQKQDLFSDVRDFYNNNKCSHWLNLA